jgi:transcriptional regulator with XRE-family HTH domain
MPRRRVLPEDPENRLQNLARLLELKGWTQTQLASRAGLGTAYVNQLLTGRKKSPRLPALDRLAAALGVSSAVLIDQRLSDAQLRIELSQGALREALAAGIAHPKFSRFRGTDAAPVTVEGWEALVRILEIADRPKTRRSTRATRREPSELG